MKQLPLSPRPEVPARRTDEPAILWPDGGQSTHRELLSSATGGPQLFPRDRILPLCPLAGKGALILAILAAVRGGASLSCIEETQKDPESAESLQSAKILRDAELLRAAELLRPTVLIGESAFLDELFNRDTPVEQLLSGNFLTRPLALSLAGRRVMKSLGGNVRYYGMSAGPPPDRKIGRSVKYLHLAQGSKLDPQNSVFQQNRGAPLAQQ
jgi:hypothetical protein